MVSGGQEESQEREPFTASCCWAIGSDDCRETTSESGNTVAVGDTDHENGVTFDSLFQERGEVRGAGASFVFVQPEVEQKSRSPGKTGQRKSNIAAQFQAFHKRLTHLLPRRPTR